MQDSDDKDEDEGEHHGEGDEDEEEHDGDDDNDADLAMMKSLSARLSGSENARGPRYTSLQCFLLLPWMIKMIWMTMIWMTMIWMAMIWMTMIWMMVIWMRMIWMTILTRMKMLKTENDDLATPFVAKVPIEINPGTPTKARS